MPSFSAGPLMPRQNPYSPGAQMPRQPQPPRTSGPQMPQPGMAGGVARPPTFGRPGSAFPSPGPMPPRGGQTQIPGMLGGAYGWAGGLPAPLMGQHPPSGGGFGGGAYGGPVPRLIGGGGGFGGGMPMPQTLRMGVAGYGEQKQRNPYA